MFPWVYGFTWQAGNVVFLAVFYTVAGIIVTTFGVAGIRGLRDFKSNHMDEIKWHVGFNELSDFAKACRHVFTGEISDRICPNGFDCRVCALHAKVLDDTRPKEPSSMPESGDIRKAAASIFGLDMPTDRLYHRGHTWVRKERDGTLMVGLDDFGERVVGNSAYPDFPGIGTKLSVNGTGWFFRNDGSAVRVLSPVDGEVIAVGGPGTDFYLKVRPGNDCDLRHLLKGEEIRPWIMRELERLEALLSSRGSGVSLADGGELVKDMPANYPGVNWDGVLGEMFLEP